MNQYDTFINEHRHQPISQVALLLSKKVDWPKAYIINQINGRQKAKTKFPFLVPLSDFIYPSPKSVEQASSESTARFKASLFSGHQMIDLSGGMGIDSLCFAEAFNHLTYVEPNKDLCKNFKHNSELLQLQNIKIIQQDAKTALSSSESTFDLIYIDPDRRNGHQRLFKINECEPQLNELMPIIWEKSKALLLKVSPMLDIKQILKELPHCKSIYVVALKNEVKELLLHMEKENHEACIINCINLDSDQAHFEFNFSDEEASEVVIEPPKKYLYDPNAAILKAGAFKSIGQKYGLSKIAMNTHLYTSDELKNDFPGRIFELIKTVHPSEFKKQKVNVITRNYSLKAENLKQKFKIKDGGDEYLMAFKDAKNKDGCLHLRRVK